MAEFKEFQRSSAARRQVGEVALQAHLLDGCDGISSADDDGSRAFRECLGDRMRAVIERFFFEYAEGAVPKNCCRLFQNIGPFPLCLGADIQAGPSIRDSGGKHRRRLAGFDGDDIEG